MRTNPCPATAAEFLRRLGHRVALIGRKPVDHAPKSMVIWPAEQDDVVDHACYLSSLYHAVYVNLNPLAAYILDVVPEQGRSITDAMIASRTRVLIDIDGHDVPKDIACEQKDAIKAEIGEPLIETDSGNGFGLIYTCQLPNDEQSKHRVRVYLQRLKSRFPCVDTSVFGAGRLTRLIGTLNRSVIDGGRVPTAILN
jgi:hypothetical protein